MNDELERLWRRFYALTDRELMRQCLEAIARLMRLRYGGEGMF